MSRSFPQAEREKESFLGQSSVTEQESGESRSAGAQNGREKQREQAGLIAWDQTVWCATRDMV